MPSYNKTILMGHLTRDIDFKFLPNQTALASFGLACNRKFKTQAGEEREEVLFIDCQMFGPRAEVLNQYMSKGKPLFVEGHLKTDSWEDRNGGGKRSKITLTVENFQFIGGRDDGARDEAEKPRQQSRPAQVAADAPDLSEQQFDEADIPFASALA
jgi:single-strand DNA-binding protein